MLHEAWWQTFQTGCAPAALVATWPSSALHSESSTLYWHTWEGGGRCDWCGWLCVCFLYRFIFTRFRCLLQSWKLIRTVNWFLKCFRICHTHWHIQLRCVFLNLYPRCILILDLKYLLEIQGCCHSSGWTKSGERVEVQLDILLTLGAPPQAGILVKCGDMPSWDIGTGSGKVQSKTQCQISLKPF